uniref:Uncharacterized protein n=1 Tax=Leersia perrieri TaxID=77586 RepID=A0A0D9VAE8_9ORYZ
MASSTAPSTARLLLRLPAANGPVTAAVELLPTRRPRRREAVRAAAHVRRIEAAAWLGRRRRGREEDAAAAAATRCAAAGEVVGSAAGAGIGRSAGVDVAIAAAAVVAMGTGNRVLYKLALVPLRDYPFFLAQFATVGPIGGFSSSIRDGCWSCSFWGFDTNIITDISCLAASVVCYFLEEACWCFIERYWNFVATANDNIILSPSRRYGVEGGNISECCQEIEGSFHVSLVAILVKVMGSTIPSATNIHQRWHCLLSKYGITIFGGATVTATICVGQYGLQYITSTLAKDFFSSIPLSIYAFTLPLPYIGVASTLPPGFVAGAAVLTAGLLLYSFPQPQKSPGNPSAAGIPS